MMELSSYVLLSCYHAAGACCNVFMSAVSVLIPLEIGSTRKQNRLKLSFKNWVKLWQTYQCSRSRSVKSVLMYRKHCWNSPQLTRLYFPDISHPRLCSFHIHHFIKCARKGQLMGYNIAQYPYSHGFSQHLSWPWNRQEHTCASRITDGHLNHKK